MAVSVKHDKRVQFVDYIIKKCSNLINEKNYNLDSALHIAVGKSNMDAIEVLIKQDSLKQNLMDKNGETALHLSARLNLLDICKLLITHGFDPNSLSLSGFNGYQLASSESLKHYLKEFNQQTTFDNTAFDIQLLLESSKSGDLEVIKRILNLNPTLVSCCDKDGRLSTPLHFAGTLLFTSR